MNGGWRSHVLRRFTTGLDDVSGAHAAHSQPPTRISSRYQTKGRYSMPLSAHTDLASPSTLAAVTKTEFLCFVGRRP